MANWYKSATVVLAWQGEMHNLFDFLTSYIVLNFSDVLGHSVKYSNKYECKVPAYY